METTDAVGDQQEEKEATTAAEETTAVEETTENVQTYDTSWASNSLQMLIPEPPFEVLYNEPYFYVDEEGGVDKGYGGKNTTTWAEMEGYGNLLAACGFTDYMEMKQLESDPEVVVHQFTGLNPDTLCYVVFTHYVIPVDNAIAHTMGWEPDTTMMTTITIYDLNKTDDIPNSLGQKGFTMP